MHDGTDPNPPACPVPHPATSRWIGCYALLGAVLAYALVARWFLPLVISEPIGVEPADGTAARFDTVLPSEDAAQPTPLVFDDRIDPNLADWPELTRLPGIGEVTAKRIVEYRQEHATAAGAAVFRSAEDLARVRGIGPKTVEAIKPLLKFDENTSDPAVADR